MLPVHVLPASPARLCCPARHRAAQPVAVTVLPSPVTVTRLPHSQPRSTCCPALASLASLASPSTCSTCCRPCCLYLLDLLPPVLPLPARPAAARAASTCSTCCRPCCLYLLDLLPSPSTCSTAHPTSHCHCPSPLPTSHHATSTTSTD